MTKEIYQVIKNGVIEEDFDWLFISSFSPFLNKMHEICHINNLVIIDNENKIRRDLSYPNVNNIIFVDVDFSSKCIDYGIVRTFISKFDINKNNKIRIDTTNLVIQIYSYIYTYLIDIVKCEDIWFIYHEIKSYDNPKEFKYHDGELTTVQLECFQISEVQKKELIVYLIGFEGMLTNIIERDREPEKKIIINGFPSYLLSYKDISVINNYHLLSNKFTLDYCTASNPFQTYNKLLSIYKRYNNKYKITIAPCGSTPSSIGTVMFATTRSDVSIIIAKPEKYIFLERDYKNRWIYCLK